MAAMGIGNLLAGWHTRAMQLQNGRIAAAIIHDAIEHAQQKQSQSRRPLSLSTSTKVAELPCRAICDAQPVEVHEPEQGKWWISIPRCPECHRGRDGWHGTRQRWKLRKMDELTAINNTIEAIYG